jgi:cephalosporin hydroxylase
MFKGIHDITSRDITRDWTVSKVKTDHFDVAVQGAPAYQNPWELAQMIEVYCNTQPANVLELGPYHGGTLWNFIKNSYTNIRVGAVDFFDELLGPRYATPSDWEQWAKEAEIKFKFFEGNTHDPEIIEQVKVFFPLGLDWLFIDANHSYEDVRADFENYGDLVVPGGVIGIHDIRPKSMGTYQLWDEIRNAGYVTQQIVADPYDDSADAGIGLVFV